MSEYKKTHGDSKYVKYESSTLTPLELEAYAHQADKDYLKTREPFAYKKYETPEGAQQVFKKIGARNDEDIKKQLKSKNPATKSVEYDIDRLDDIINTTKDTEWTMRVFNAVDDANEISNILPLLEEKLRLIKNHPDNQVFNTPKTKEKYLETYWDDVDAFKKKVNTYEWEANKHNITSKLEDDFTNEEAITETIGELKKKLDIYRKEPTRFRLESKKDKEDNIQIEIPPK